MTSSALEERMARVEGALEQIDRRLTTLEQRLTTLERDTREGLDRVSTITREGLDRVNNRIDSLMYWQLGLLGAIAASTVAIVLTR